MRPLQGCSKGTDAVQSQRAILHLDLYEVGPDRPAIIFIPGMGCHAGIYEEFLRGVAERGFNVIGIDLPGHGRSSGRRGVFSFSSVMDAVSDVVAYAVARYGERVGLMGSSLGGTFALYAAARDTRLKAVLCHNAMDISEDLHIATRYPGLVRFLIRHLRILADIAPWLPVPLRVLVDWNHVVERKTLLRLLLRDKTMVWTYSLGSWNSFLEYPQVEFSRIAMPAKLIVGSKDRLFPPEYCERLARRIGKDGAAFEMVEGGHMLPLENTAQTVAVAAEWFEENLTCDEECRGHSTLP